MIYKLLQTKELYKMKTIIDPLQNELFDIAESEMSALAFNRLKTSIYAVFHYMVLPEMPALKLGNHFHDLMGRPTKELYSMCGLILLKEFHNWTTSAAVDAYLYDMRVHFALKMGSSNVSFCERTLERYMALIRQDNMGNIIFDRVTEKLIKELDLKVDQQRLDSTHVFSDMATFSRTKLMGVTIKRFLVQLKRHYFEEYLLLPDVIRDRYEKDESAMFADASKDKEKRSSLRQDVAEEMHLIIQRFSGHCSIEGMTTFKNLVTVFTQQCEVLDIVEVIDESKSDNNTEGVAVGSQAGEMHSAPSKTPEKNEKNSENSDDIESNTEPEVSSEKPAKAISVRKKTGGNVIQNPSDLDATYDGHKGPGHQIQLAETCNPENEVQLITSAIPQTAVVSDANAIVPVLESLKESGRMPEELLADSLYGSDDNVMAAAGEGVALVSPVCGAPPKKPPEDADAKQRRLNNRRIAQEEPRWKKKYNLRAQEEGTIGSIKRKTGMVRLRYRGEESVNCSMVLKVTGWNISRATASVEIQAKIKAIIENEATSRGHNEISAHTTIVPLIKVLWGGYLAIFETYLGIEKEINTMVA